MDRVQAKSWPLPSNHFILGRLKSPIKIIFGKSVDRSVILLVAIGNESGGQ